MWRWQSCPTDENAYEWEIVKGSADLTPSWSHDFIEDSTSVRFGRISSSPSKVETRSSASVSGSWNTGNIFDYFWNLVQILLSGSVTTRNGFDVTVSYSWLGSTVSETRHIDTKVVIPVERVEYVWD